MTQIEKGVNEGRMREYYDENLIDKREMKILKIEF